MKTHKKNTFTDIYVQQTVGISGEIHVFKLKLKAEYAENKPLRSHFFSSAKALKTYSGKQFLTFLQLIDNEQEAAILFQTKTAKSLPEYLAEKENLSDKELSTLFEQMAQCLGTLHQGMLFYPALQPSSFFVDTDGQVQLSFFDILEFRMYQYQQITPDSKVGFMTYLSPERNNNFFSISLESDIYSLGLIYWHVFLFAKSPVKNWKLITENTYFSPTETVWDDFFETCLQEQGTQRYKSTHALVKALPRFGNAANTSENNQPQKTTPPLTIEKEEQINSTSQKTSSTRQPKQNFLEIEKLKAMLIKYKTAMIIIIFSLIIIFFQFYQPPIIDPIIPRTTANATTNEESNSGTDNNNKTDTTLTPDPLKLVNPPGYTVKTGSEAILTEKGILHYNKRYYRFYNYKWEYSEINKDNWKTTPDADKLALFLKFFIRNSAEKNLILEQEKQITLPKNPPNKIVKKVGDNGGGNTGTEGFGCGLLRNLLLEVDKPHASGEGLTIQRNLVERLKNIDRKLCTSCKNGLTWGKVRVAIISMDR